MTVGRAAVLTAGFLGAFALGVAIGPPMMRWTTGHDAQSPAPTTQTVGEKTETPVATPARPATPRVRRATSPPRASESTTASTVSVSLSEPRLHAKVKPLLNQGARLDVAAEGFKNAEQFAAV